jgi:chromosome segregation ATPase
MDENQLSYYHLPGTADFGYFISHKRRLNTRNALNPTIHTQKEIKQLFEALLQERKHAEELVAENEALCTQVQHLKKLVKEGDLLKQKIAHDHEKHEKDKDEWLSDKEALIEHIELLGKDIQQLWNANEAKQQAIDTLTANATSHEEQIDAATQHVAKKIREAALLSATVESLQEQITQLQHAAAKDKESLIELQELMEKEKDKENQWLLKVEQSAHECSEWKEKSQQWATERLLLQQKIQELKEMEAKHQRLEEFFCGFDTLLKNRCDPAPEREFPSVAVPQSLFDRPPLLPARTKGDLFE